MRKHMSDTTKKSIPAIFIGLVLYGVLSTPLLGIVAGSLFVLMLIFDSVKKFFIGFALGVGLAILLGPALHVLLWGTLAASLILLGLSFWLVSEPASPTSRR